MALLGSKLSNCSVQNFIRCLLSRKLSLYELNFSSNTNMFYHILSMIFFHLNEQQPSASFCFHFIVINVIFTIQMLLLIRQCQPLILNLFLNLFFGFVHNFLLFLLLDNIKKFVCPDLIKLLRFLSQDLKILNQNICLLALFTISQDLFILYAFYN